VGNEFPAKTSGGRIDTELSSGGGISNPLGCVASAGLSLLGGTKKNDSSSTRSDIAASTVVVRDSNESALAGLDRTATGFDTDSALSAVDLRKMQERAEVMPLGGQLLFEGVGDLGGYLSRKAETEEGKSLWADGGNGLVLLHGMARAAMAARGRLCAEGRSEYCWCGEGQEGDFGIPSAREGWLKLAELPVAFGGGRSRHV